MEEEVGKMDYCRRFLKALLGISVLFLLMVTVGPTLLSVVRRYPLNSLIVVGILVGSGIACVLYMGELAVLGWIVDFLDSIGMPKPKAGAVPLEYEEIGDMVVVTLRDNVGTVFQCQAVQKKVKDLLDERHCDFVFDFRYAGRVSHSFRKVLFFVAKAARLKAVPLGRPYHLVALPHGAVFRVFDDRERAVEEMSNYDGHGWVVLCSVPVGIRAVSELT
jgi:hypothetical protein